MSTSTIACDLDAGDAQAGLFQVRLERRKLGALGRFAPVAHQDQDCARRLGGAGARSVAWLMLAVLTVDARAGSVVARAVEGASATCRQSHGCQKLVRWRISNKMEVAEAG